MRYSDFRDTILRVLRRNRSGLTWSELRDRLELPYERPCPEWLGRMERESGFVREKGPGRKLVWKARQKP